MGNILESAHALSETIIQWYRDLHQIPEVGLHLPLTRDYVCKSLEELGIPYETFAGHSGICATLTGGRPGATVALRADMDALHIQEETGLSYAATNGNMHACGHDAHTAMLLGAAKMLAEQRDTLSGNVKFLFQAGEEGCGGAKRMVADGVLNNPDVGAVFGQHVGSLSTETENGKFGFYSGGFMAARDSFAITVKGKGCHGSQPAQGVDPVVISAYLITTLQTVISRETGLDNPAVLTIGSIHGGEVYNVIPDEVVMKGALRCFSEESRLYFRQRIREVCESVCSGMRGSCEIVYEPGYPVTVNDSEMTRFAMDSAARTLGEDAVQMLHHPLSCSEDMSFFLQECPGCYWCVNTLPPQGAGYPNHSPHFTVNEEMLHKGAAVLAGIAQDWLAAQNKN